MGSCTAGPRERTVAGMANEDPVVTDPEHYRTVFENEYVRVLEYHDEPGDQTHPHVHPNSLMITLSGFRRQLEVNGTVREVQLEASRSVWLPAQRHTGRNIGTTPTHTMLVELKGPAAGIPTEGMLGPDVP